MYYKACAVTSLCMSLCWPTLMWRAGPSSVGVTQPPPPPLPPPTSLPPHFPFFLRVFTLIGSSWTVSRKSRSAECINETDHPGKLFSPDLLRRQCEDTRVCHALKTLNEHSQEQCSPAATFPAGWRLLQVLINVFPPQKKEKKKKSEVFWTKTDILLDQVGVSFFSAQRQKRVAYNFDIQFIIKLMIDWLDVWIV